MPVTVALNSLDKEMLMRILKEPKNSIVKQYKKLFELDGVELQFEERHWKPSQTSHWRERQGPEGCVRSWRNP